MTIKFISNSYIQKAGFIANFIKDVDECKGNHGCQHQCINTPGSYKCKCRSGFTLKSDGKTCNGVGDKSKDPNNKDRVTVEPTTKYPVTTEPVTENPVTTDPTEYPKSQDCYELYQNGHNKTGIYTIWPNSSSFPNRSMEVRCDMDTEGGGWTVIQRRGDFTPQEDFYRDWNDYKQGFGNPSKDFWLGNDNIFLLTNQRKYKVRFDLESADGEKAYAVYGMFRIENEASKYKLQIESYTGNATDSMGVHNGNYFSTKDSGNIRCAAKEKSGWWFSNCGNANLNGKYILRKSGSPYDFFYWYNWKKEGLAAAEVKIKPSAT